MSGQFYVAVLGTFMLPFYFRWMGPECYGLIGFFTMLQASLNFFDLGFTAILIRETARFKQGVADAKTYGRLYRTVEILFFLFMLLLGSLLLGFSPYIAKTWLHAQTMPVSELQFAVQAMTFCLAFRWMGTLYRAVIMGNEAILWLAGFSGVMTTLRFVGVLPVMAFWGSKATVFFFYQTLIALIETIGYWIKTKRLTVSLGYERNRQRLNLSCSFKRLLPSLRFSVSIGFTTLIWCVVTQADKLMLSTLLPLKSYGYFSTATLIANGIFVMMSATTAVMIPRLTALVGRGEEEKLIAVYRSVTQWITTLLTATVLTLIIGGKALLWAWIGDKAVVDHAAILLSLYATGNAIFALTAFPYYLQSAKGDLRLHVIGHIILLVLFLPFCYVAVKYNGSRGAGYTWVIASAGYLFIWVAKIHHRISPGLHRQWLLADVGRVVILSFIAACLYAKMPLSEDSSRLVSFIWVVGCWLIIFGMACLGIPSIIASIKQFFTMMFKLKDDTAVE